MDAEAISLWKAAIILIAMIGVIWNLRRSASMPNPTPFRLVSVGFFSVTVLVVLML